MGSRVFLPRQAQMDTTQWLFRRFPYSNKACLGGPFARCNKYMRVAYVHEHGAQGAAGYQSNNEHRRAV